MTWIWKLLKKHSQQCHIIDSTKSWCISLNAASVKYQSAISWPALWRSAETPVFEKLCRQLDGRFFSCVETSIHFNAYALQLSVSLIYIILPSSCSTWVSRSWSGSDGHYSATGQHRPSDTAAGFRFVPLADVMFSSDLCGNPAVQMYDSSTCCRGGGSAPLINHVMSC